MIYFAVTFLLYYLVAMTGRTHDIAAITALTVTIIIFPPTEKITLATGLVALIANMIGGVAPDIDQPTAPLWRNLRITGVLGRTIARLLGGHRFLSHSIIGIFLFGFGFQYILNLLQPSFPQLNLHIIWSAFIIGYVSHLVMDTFTKEGVPWLLPIPVKFGVPPFKFLRITTGSYWEKYIILPGLIMINCYLYYRNYPLFLEILQYNIK